MKETINNIEVNSTVFNSQFFEKHQVSQVELENQNKFLSQEEISLKNNMNLKDTFLRSSSFDTSFLKM